LYQQLARERQDGITAIHGCDGLLWGSLYHYSDVSIEIDSYRNQNRWFRSPGQDCFPERSSSSVSRDQFTGLYYAILKDQRLDLAVGIIEYAEDNNFIMGEGSLGATRFSVNQLGLVGRLAKYLGYPNKYALYPVIFPPGNERYHAHLELLSIFLIHKLEGQITSNHYSIVQNHHNRNPRNALAALLYAIYSGSSLDQVQDILLDESLFPADRLPAPGDRCGFYLWQYEVDQRNHAGTGYHWQPCVLNEVFGGLDFLFAATLYIEEVERANNPSFNDVYRVRY
jgi:hypothetical protein